MASQDKLGVMVFADATGLPNAAATPGWVDYRRASTGADVNPKPARTNLGGGKFGVIAPVGDVGAGIAWLLDAGAGNHFGASGSRYMSGGFFDDANPYGVVHLVNAATGALWAGVAPAFNALEGWDDFTGALKAAPALVAVSGAYLWSFKPTALDLSEGRVYRLDSPAGASPGFWFGSFFGGAGAIGAEPDKAIADLLAAIAPGPSLGTVTVDIFRGPVLPASPSIVPHQAIFCLASGGPKPDPYFKVAGVNASFYRVGVQIRVRSAPGKMLVGQQLAVQVRNKVHLARIAGYDQCSADSSHPIYLGKDDTEHHEWSVNCALWFKQ
jgi:hypothetical protein